MLLDTHVWIWAADGGAKLGPKTRRRLTKVSGAVPTFVSTASIFEITALHTAGRLQLTLPAERWIRQSIERGGLRILDIEPDIAMDAGLIPSSTLADPIDRFLVATAREYDVPLVTRDRRVLDYAASSGLVRVIDAAV